jgi:hypothetical protein
VAEGSDLEIFDFHQHTTRVGVYRPAPACD